MDYNAEHVAEFFRMMSAFLAANLLTVAFVYGVFSYSRRERDGTQNEAGSSSLLSAAALPMAFLIGGLYFTFFH